MEKRRILTMTGSMLKLCAGWVKKKKVNDVKVDRINSGSV